MKLQNNNDLENQKRLLIIKSIFKGIAHATLIPLLIMMLVNANIEGNFGGVAAMLYLLIPAKVYKEADNKDISKYAFIKTLQVIVGFIAFFTILSLLAAFQ